MYICTVFKREYWYYIMKLYILPLGVLYGDTFCLFAL
nr:MAG TPA: hypothetical protein [Caudoviricetes sp.]